MSFLSSPDGAHSDESTPDPSQAIYAEFDDDFEDEELTAPIGKCTAMYNFPGELRHTVKLSSDQSKISMDTLSLSMLLDILYIFHTTNNFKYHHHISNYFFQNRKLRFLLGMHSSICYHVRFYLLSGASEGTISMQEGEVLAVVEEDKGDGWTRVRRNNGDEGYIPTSYVTITLNK